jgi:hypothetical protein
MGKVLLDSKLARQLTVDYFNQLADGNTQIFEGVRERILQYSSHPHSKQFISISIKSKQIWIKIGYHLKWTEIFDWNIHTAEKFLK